MFYITYYLILINFSTLIVKRLFSGNAAWGGALGKVY